MCVSPLRRVRCPTLEGRSTHQGRAKMSGWRRSGANQYEVQVVLLPNRLQVVVTTGGG